MALTRARGTRGNTAPFGFQRPGPGGHSAGVPQPRVVRHPGEGVGAGEEGREGERLLPHGSAGASGRRARGRSRGAPVRRPLSAPCSLVRDPVRAARGRRPESQLAGARAARCPADERARLTGVGGPRGGGGRAQRAQSRGRAGGARRGSTRGRGGRGGLAAAARAAARGGRELSIMQGLGRRGGRARARGALQDGAHRSPARRSLGASAVRPRLPGPALGPPLPLSPPLP